MMLTSKFLEKNHQKKVKIAVFGDAMIDQYHIVDVKRISPEAPIPVMLSPTDRPSYILPGGAANVVAQLKNFNVDCILFSLMGREDAAIFERCGIKLPEFYSGEYLESRIPRKIRFQDHQSLIRWDIEQENYGGSIEEKIDSLIFCLEHYFSEGKTFDVVILSDYGKGIFKSFRKTQDIITLCHSYGVKTVVDPKKLPIEKWSGCTYFKPNSVEAENFTNSKTPEHQCQKLADFLPNSNIIVTHGGDGVSGCTASGDPFSYCSNKKISVKNFSGAGDCFAAFFSLAVAHGFSPPECAEIGYKAGEAYVQSNHNKPILPLDLYESKFVLPQDLVTRDFKLVVVNGCYDLLTSAHISTFEFAKTKGDKLAVLINSDESVKRLKGNARPIIPLEQRKKIIAALDCVDFVIDFTDDSPYNLISEIKADILVKGGDFNRDFNRLPRSASVVKEFYFAPCVEGVSTSKIVEKIKKGA